MTRTEIDTNKVVWKISVPREMDEAVRLYLASQEEKTDALSDLVQKAVSCYLLSSFSAEAKRKVSDSGLLQSELDEIIDKGIAWAKNNQNECAF